MDADVDSGGDVGGDGGDGGDVGGVGGDGGDGGVSSVQCTGGRSGRHETSHTSLPSGLLSTPTPDLSCRQFRVFKYSWDMLELDI